MSLVASGILAAGLILGCGNEADSDSPGDAVPSVTEEDSPEDEEFVPAPFTLPPDPLDDGLPDELVLHVDYVVNQIETEGIEEIGFVTAPETLTLQKETTAQNIDWRKWGPDEAIGVGSVTGVWCFPLCFGDNVEVRITLCDIQDGEFTRYTVEGHIPWNEEDIPHLTGVLIGTGGEYDPDNDFGCMDISPEDLEALGDEHSLDPSGLRPN